MNRRSFLALSAFAPASAVTSAAVKPGPYQQAPAPGLRGRPFPTGIRSLDEILGGGLGPGELTLMASIPGQRRLACLGLSVINRHIERNREPAALVTPYCSREDVTHQLAIGRADVHRFRADTRKWASDDERARYLEARQAIETSSMHYESIQRLRFLADVEQSLRKVHEAHPLAFVFIDEIEELRDIACAESRGVAAARVGRQLRNMARCMNVPVLATCLVTKEFGLAAKVSKNPYGCMPSQADLGPLIPILDCCDALLLTCEMPEPDWPDGSLRVEIAFHPRVRRFQGAVLTMNWRTGRITDGA